MKRLCRTHCNGRKGGSVPLCVWTGWLRITGKLGAGPWGGSDLRCWKGTGSKAAPVKRLSREKEQLASRGAPHLQVQVGLGQ